MTLSNILTFFQSYSPILLPLSAWVISLIYRHIPSQRFAKLQQIASTVVPAVQQQANGGWTNEQKYNAAAQAVNLLAAKFGYRVSEAEVKVLIEGAVAGFKSLTASTSAAPAFAAPVAAGQDSPTQPDAPVAGAV